MKSTRKLSRRSFLTRVAGGAIVGGGAMIALTGGAQAFQTTDSDSGATADRPGNGRGNRQTDSDSSDRANCGRGRR